MDPDKVDANTDALAPVDEIEDEESDGVAAELELLMARVQATRFSGA